MGKYDGLTAKELRTRLLEADKLELALSKANHDLEKMARSEKEAKEAVEKLLADATEQNEAALKEASRRTGLANDRVHALSHDLEYERSRRISAENARFDLEQRLHSLSNTHIEVPAIREIMPGLRIDRNGDIA